MGSFWDSYTSPTGQGGAYASARDMARDNEVAFIQSITKTEGQYGPAFRLGIVKQENGEQVERIVDFVLGRVQSRDSMLTAMRDHFDAGGEPVKVRFELDGQAVILVQA